MVLDGRQFGEAPDDVQHVALEFRGPAQHVWSFSPILPDTLMTKSRVRDQTASSSTPS